MAMGGSDLSPVAERVLKFSIERAGDDGLRYEDYMEGLGTILSGITISQLSIALHQLETKGLLHPDPHGTPNRKIRVTPAGKQAVGVKEEAHVEASAPEPAPQSSPPSFTPPPPAPTVVETPQPKAPPEEPAPVQASSHDRTPSPEASSGSPDSSDDIRRRLRAVMTREDTVTALEEKVRLKERELLNEEDRLAALEKQLEQRRKTLDEQEKQLAASEDQLHEHITSLKGHLANVGQVSDSVHKLHEKVTQTRQKRQRPA